jgi:hypothetical protein
VWHLPNDPNTHTTRQLVDLVFQQPTPYQVKPLLIRLAALTTASRTWSASWPRRANDEPATVGRSRGHSHQPPLGKPRDGPA